MRVRGAGIKEIGATVFGPLPFSLSRSVSHKGQRSVTKPPVTFSRCFASSSNDRVHFFALSLLLVSTSIFLPQDLEAHIRSANWKQELLAANIQLRYDTLPHALPMPLQPTLNHCYQLQ